MLTTTNTWREPPSGDWQLDVHRRCGMTRHWGTLFREWLRTPRLPDLSRWSGSPSHLHTTVLYSWTRSSCSPPQHVVVEDMRRLGWNDTIVEASKKCDHDPTTLQIGWSIQWTVKFGRWLLYTRDVPIQISWARRRHLGQVCRGSRRENREWKDQKETVPCRGGGLRQKSDAQNVLQVAGRTDGQEIGEEMNCSVESDSRRWWRKCPQRKVVSRRETTKEMKLRTSDLNCIKSCKQMTWLRTSWSRMWSRSTRQS